MFEMYNVEECSFAIFMQSTGDEKMSWIHIAVQNIQNSGGILSERVSAKQK